MVESYYWIWLQQILGVGTIRSEQFLSMNISPKKLYEMSGEKIEKLYFFTVGEIAKIKNTTLSRAKSAYEFCRKTGVEIITPDNPKYPIRLRNIYSPPLTLYVQGELPNLDEKLSIAMVGARECTEYGERAARLITKELVEQGVIIVSGLAIGIDGICHETAINQGGKTVAVIAGGIDTDPPMPNRDLRKRIIRGNGAVVTEYMPGTQSRSFNFQTRNRIISALSAGVCIVEAAERSGTTITAAHALAQDRDVYAVPGSIFNEKSYGANKLIQQGAKPVTCGRDILEEYSEYRNYILSEQRVFDLEEDAKQISFETNSKENVKKISKKAPSYLNDYQSAVYNCIAEGEKTKEEISIITGLPVEKVLSTLTQLEIFGHIKTISGNKFGV